MKNRLKNLSVPTLIVVTILAVLLVPLLVAAQAGILMLLLGAAHAEISQDIPALSFVGSLIAFVLLSLVGALFRGSRDR